MEGGLFSFRFSPSFLSRAFDIRLLILIFLIIFFIFFFLLETFIILCLAVQSSSFVDVDQITFKFV